MERRRRYFRFLQDPDDLRVMFYKCSDIHKRGNDAGKRKYSVEMRQKATIREKNRIKAIGKEFSILAELLPKSNGGKRSHQKILNDTVAYIRALEVELNIIDEKSLLESWSTSSDSDNGSCEEEQDLQNGHDSGDADSLYNYEMLEMNDIYGPTPYTNILQRDLNFRNPLSHCCLHNAMCCTSNFGNKVTETRLARNEAMLFYKDVKTEVFEAECEETEKYSGIIYNGSRDKNDFMLQVGDEDVRQQEFKEETTEVKVFNNQQLSFDKVVTGFNFKL